MALIDLDKFVASFITEMRECSQMRNFSIPRCIKKALVDQGLDYKGGEIIKTQCRVSAEAKENGYGESEDERIRKDLIAIFKGQVPFTSKEDSKRYITWLEKQGNPNKEYWRGYKDGMKSILDRYSELKMQEQQEEPQVYEIEDGKVITYSETDGYKVVEPKFKVGDWVVWDNKISCHVDNVYQGKESLMYTITDINNMTRSYSVKGFDNNAHLWTIQDAKDGDVLKEDSCIFIIAKLGDNGHAAKTYCCLFDDGEFNDGSILCFDVEGTKPATKEQRDLLFQKMHEAGYTFDFEKKELKEIHVIDEGKSEMDYCFTKMMNGEKVTPAWSEEDEDMIQALNACIDATIKSGMNYISFDSKSILIGKVKNWLKSFTETMKGKKINTVWSEEDEKNISTIRIALRDAKLDAPEEFESYGRETTVKDFENAESWLKSIKPQLKHEFGEEDEDDLNNIIWLCNNCIRQCELTWTPSQATRIKSLIERIKDTVFLQPKQEWKQENVGELSDFENAMMHIGRSFFGENTGLDPNDTAAIKEQAKLLLELSPKTEWSKEDDVMVHDILGWLPAKSRPEYNQRRIDWLKSLKTRITWKPSDEQMRALHDMNLTGNISYAGQGQTLIELYNDLRKL